VDVRTSRERDGAIIQAGTGPRIPEDLRPDVFTPFVSRKIVPRPGSGLSIVRAPLRRRGREAVLAGAVEGDTVLHGSLPILGTSSPQRHEA
jgi:nitrogen-specific signal transduction histidine kinase